MGVSVGRGVAVGGNGVGVGRGEAVAVGSWARVGRETAVGSGVWVVVAAGGLSAVATAVGASCPPDWVQAAKAMRMAAEIEDAAVSFRA